MNKGRNIQYFSQISKYLNRALIWTEFTLIVTAGILLFTMSVLVTANVLSRWLLNYSLPIIVSIEIYFMVGIIFLALPILQRREGNVRIEVLSRNFPEIINKFIRIAHRFLILSLFVFMVYIYYLTTISAFVTGEARPGIIHYPLSISWALATIGLIVLVLRIISQLVTEIAGVR